MLMCISFVRIDLVISWRIKWLCALTEHNDLYICDNSQKLMPVSCPEEVRFVEGVSCGFIFLPFNNVSPVVGF